MQVRMAASCTAGAGVQHVLHPSDCSRRPLRARMHDTVSAAQCCEVRPSRAMRTVKARRAPSRSAGVRQKGCQ